MYVCMYVCVGAGTCKARFAGSSGQPAEHHRHNLSQGRREERGRGKGTRRRGDIAVHTHTYIHTYIHPYYRLSASCALTSS